MGKPSAELIAIEGAADRVSELLKLINSSLVEIGRRLDETNRLLDSYQSTLAHFLDLDARAKREESLRRLEQAKTYLPTADDYKY